MTKILADLFDASLVWREGDPFFGRTGILPVISGADFTHLLR